MSDTGTLQSEIPWVMMALALGIAIGFSGGMVVAQL